MKVNKSGDISVNRVTIQKLLEPVIEFINEHKDDRTVCSVIDTTFDEIISKSTIPPSMMYGILECVKMRLNSAVNLASKMQALEEIAAQRPVRKEK